MSKDEKRSSSRESAQLPLALDHPDQGVGARQAPRPTPPGGGGYQDVCTVFEFQKKPPTAEKKSTRDPRLDELRHMGLPRVWLQAAEAVGVDAFLKIWRIIDADPSSWHNDTSLRVRLRPYKSYLRYQRNRFIEALTVQGVKADEIKRRLRQQLGEDVSHRHITRLAKADKIGRV